MARIRRGQGPERDSRAAAPVSRRTGAAGGSAGLSRLDRPRNAGGGTTIGDRARHQGELLGPVAGRRSGGTLRRAAAWRCRAPARAVSRRRPATRLDHAGAPTVITQII